MTLKGLFSNVFGDFGRIVAGIVAADTDMRVAIGVGGGVLPSPHRRLVKETKAMNTAIANIFGSLKLGERSWAGLIAMAMLIGVLAALAIPVYVR